MTTDNVKHAAADAKSTDVEEPQEKSATEQVTPQHAEEGKHAAHANAAHANAERAKATHAKARKRRALRIVLIVVGIILALCLIAAAALGAFVNSGKDELLADNDLGNPRQTISQDGKSYVLNENMITVALIGTDRLYGYVIDDESRGHADAIMLMAYDTSTGKVTLINVPRNMIAEINLGLLDGIEGSVSTFLSASYAYGKTDEESALFVCDTVSSLLNGIPVENYVVLLESCIDPLTEAIGGVTVTAVQDVPWVGVKKGETYTMTGNQALRYVQWRNIHEKTSPTDRMKRQHDFAQAFLHQSIDAIKKDPSIIGKFYDIITDPQYMTTNLHTNELAYLVSAVVTNGVNDLEIVTLPYTPDYEEETGLMAYLPDRKGITDLLLKVYYEPAD